jgi:hypothetical protein
VNDTSGIPTAGKSLVILAVVDQRLHFRVFDSDGRVVVDTDEKGLAKQARQIDDLRKLLESLWPPHKLTESEKARVIKAVTSIVGHTPLGKVAPAAVQALEARLRPKLILLPAVQDSVGQDALQSGRLPAADSDEVFAGSAAPEHDRLTIGDHTLKVVGVLKPDVAVFADCYLINRSESTNDLFPADDDSVRHASLVRLTPERSRDRKVVQQLERAYPESKYVLVTPVGRFGRNVYYPYLAGQAILLVCGSGALIGLYRWLADRVKFRWLAAPLQEMQRRPRLVWGVHLAYFGLVLVCAVGIYEMPDVQTLLMTSVQGAFTSSKGVIGETGRAYLSGNVPRAAAMTFLVNFLLGALAVITLPSLILPGFGVVMATFRAITWGLLFGPTTVAMAFAMLPHVWTMLLEGEAYILATLFSLLIPVHLVQASKGSTVLGRFGRVVLLNVQASLLVALVLAVSACYEAIEVIAMGRLAVGG